jgi:uncharacterized protein DUF6894
VNTSEKAASGRVQDQRRKLSLEVGKKAAPFSGVRVMTHVYFHCSNADRIVLDPQGLEVEDFVEAHQCAAQIVRAFVASIGPDDWRSWTLHVSDESGEDIFVMPFACVVGRPH